MTIGTSQALAIGFLALVTATDAIASSDEQMRCAQPIARNMTVYRPICGPDGRGDAALLPPGCSPPCWAPDPPCPSLGRRDWSIGRHFFDLNNAP
jgi:hypothetical protein